MQQAKDALTAVVETPAARVRHETGFGAATDYGELAAEPFEIGAGTDLTPLLAGLEADACQCPHWGDVIEGEIDVRYADGSTEVDEAGDLRYWPPGHTLWVDEDTELVLFSPHDDHTAVFEHMATRMEE